MVHAHLNDSFVKMYPNFVQILWAKILTTEWVPLSKDSGREGSPSLLVFVENLTPEATLIICTLTDMAKCPCHIFLFFSYLYCDLNRLHKKYLL